MRPAKIQISLCIRSVVRSFTRRILDSQGCKFLGATIEDSYQLWFTCDALVSYLAAYLQIQLHITILCCICAKLMVHSLFTKNYFCLGSDKKVLTTVLKKATPKGGWYIFKKDNYVKFGFVLTPPHPPPPPTPTHTHTLPIWKRIYSTRKEFAPREGANSFLIEYIPFQKWLSVLSNEKKKRNNKSCLSWRKTEFEISCKLSLMETICTKCQILFSEKQKQNKTKQKKKKQKKKKHLLSLRKR